MLGALELVFSRKLDPLPWLAHKKPESTEMNQYVREVNDIAQQMEQQSNNEEEGAPSAPY